MQDPKTEALKSDCRRTMQALSRRLFLFVPCERSKIYDLFTILEVFLSSQRIDQNQARIYSACIGYANTFLQERQ